MVQGETKTSHPRTGRYVLPFLAIFVVTWGLVVAADHSHWLSLAVACALQLFVALVLFMWERGPASTPRFVAGTIALLISVGLIRYASGSNPGFDTLVILPPALAAVRNRSRELAFSIAGAAVTLGVSEAFARSHPYSMISVSAMAMVMLVTCVVAGMTLLLVRRLRATQARQRELVEQLAVDATQDGLTGIANRRSFDQQLRLELDRAARNSRELALAIFDIDHFKDINDTYGHLHGDEVLCWVAATLRHQARSGELVARFGGEEFAWLMPETSLAEARQGAERARAAVAETGLALKMDLSVSAGVCSIRGAATSKRILDCADQALYAAKRGGRNRTVVGVPPSGGKRDYSSSARDDARTSTSTEPFSEPEAERVKPAAA